MLRIVRFEPMSTSILICFVLNQELFTHKYVIWRCFSHISITYPQTFIECRSIKVSGRWRRALVLPINNVSMIVMLTLAQPNKTSSAWTLMDHLPHVCVAPHNASYPLPKCNMFLVFFFNNLHIIKYFGVKYI